jgi:hypothetical protein
LTKKELPLTRTVEDLAQRYFEAYRTFGGIKPRDKILHDLLIVGAASANGLDVVVSEDKATMILDSTVKAYTIVNETLGFRTPNFIDYSRFKKELGIQEV